MVRRMYPRAAVSFIWKVDYTRGNGSEVRFWEEKNGRYCRKASLVSPDA